MEKYIKTAEKRVANVFSLHNRRQYQNIEWFSYQQVKQIRKMIKPIATTYAYHSHRVTSDNDLVISLRDNTKMVFTKYNSDVVALNHIYRLDDDTQVAINNNLRNKTLLSMVDHFAKAFGVTRFKPNDSKEITYSIMFNNLKNLPQNIINMAGFLATVNGLSQTFKNRAVNYFKLHRRCGYLK